MFDIEYRDFGVTQAGATKRCGYVDVGSPNAPPTERMDDHISGQRTFARNSTTHEGLFPLTQSGRPVTK